MEKEHKLKSKWTIETHTDLSALDNPEFYKLLTNELNALILEQFGTFENFIE